MGILLVADWAASRAGVRKADLVAELFLQSILEALGGGIQSGVLDQLADADRKGFGIVSRSGSGLGSRGSLRGSRGSGGGSGLTAGAERKNHRKRAEKGKGLFHFGFLQITDCFGSGQE